MKHWRHILCCLFISAFVAGSAVAEKEAWAASDSLTSVVNEPDTIIDDAPLFFSKSDHELCRLSDLERLEFIGSIAMIGPAGHYCDSINDSAFDGNELQTALIDDDALGRVSGGANLFVTPEVVSQRLFAIILWDEGKSKRSVPFGLGNGQINSMITVQGR